MLTLSDPRSNPYTFTYDGMNRKLSMAYPTGGGTEIWAYDPAGILQTYTTRANQVETFTYDNRNRETNSSWSGNSAVAVTRTYDTGSRLTISSSVSALSYGYDNANQLLSGTQQLTADGGPKSVAYTYTADSKQLTPNYPNGSSVTYGYTGRDQTNSIAATGVSAGYTYDLNGNVDTKSLGNGTSASYAYDDANRFLSVNHLKGANNLVSLGYAYNTVNDRTSRIETISGVAKADTYGYDPIDQVTQVKYNFNSGTNTQDRLVNYIYDPAGNRQSLTDNGTPTSYTPNSLNQYTAIGTPLPTTDGNGNLNGQWVWTYTYDAMNRMTSAHKSGTMVNLAYDGRNRCASRTINGTITFFYYDGWSLIEEQNASSALLDRYVNGANIDEIIAAVTPTATTY